MVHGSVCSHPRLGYLHYTILGHTGKSLPPIRLPQLFTPVNVCSYYAVARLGLHRRSVGYRCSDDGAGGNIGGRHEPEDIS